MSSRVAGTTERKTYSYTGGGCYSGMGDEWGFNDTDQDWVQNERGCWVRRESLGYGNGRAYGSSMGGNTGGTSLTIHSNGHRGHNGHFAGMYPGVNGNKTNLDIAVAKAKEKAVVDKDEDDDGENDMELMTKLVARNSQAIAEILDQMGVKYEDFINEVIGNVRSCELLMLSHSAIYGWQQGAQSSGPGMGTPSSVPVGIPTEKEYVR